MATDVGVARSGRVQARIAVLAGFPGALVNDPTLGIDAMLEPPLEIRGRMWIHLRQPLAVQGAQVQQLEVEERQAPGWRSAAATPVGGNHVELTTSKDARHVRLRG